MCDSRVGVVEGVIFPNRRYESEGRESKLREGIYAWEEEKAEADRQSQITTEEKKEEKLKIIM